MRLTIWHARDQAQWLRCFSPNSVPQMVHSGRQTFAGRPNQSDGVCEKELDV